MRCGERNDRADSSVTATRRLPSVRMLAFAARRSAVARSFLDSFNICGHILGVFCTSFVTVNGDWKDKKREQ